MKSIYSSNLETVPETQLSPTAERDRIQVLDLIRAMALLGIFLVNDRSLRAVCLLAR